MKGFGSCWTNIVDEPNHQSLARKTKRIAKPREEDADDSSRLTSLPDDIILQILNKVTDLKTLCFCHVVSKRFSSIVLQVDAVSFTAPLLKSPDKSFFPDVDGDGFPRKLFRRLIKGGVGFKPLCLRRKLVSPFKPLPPDMSFTSSFVCQSFGSALRSITKFKRVKSLCIELPNSRHERIDNSLFKWNVKFGSRIESLFFLSPDSISENCEFHVNGNGDEQEQHMELSNEKFHNAFQCFQDVVVRHVIFSSYAKNLPMLEELSITESGRRGRLSMSGEKLAALKKELVSGNIDDKQTTTSIKYYYVPILNMPVSKYAMNGVTLIVIEMNVFQVENYGNDSLINSEDGFEDKEEAAYTEAVMQILKNHSNKMKVLR